MNLLLIIIIVFSVLVLIRLANVAQLAAKLSGESEEAEQDKDNKINAIGMLIFLWGGLILMGYMILHYKSFMLPVAASEHGAKVDHLMDINWIVLFIVFVVTQILLFSFAFKYRFNKARRAFFFHDNNKLEAIWTIIPTIVLAGLITTGLAEWNEITDYAKRKEGLLIQVYGKQFDWTVRYAGKDNKLGESSFRKINDNNPLGCDSLDSNVNDDLIAREMYLPVGVPIELAINSRDVLHSVYLPHFRVQMNAVPGMTTRFSFKPTITTAKMREITGNPKFDYILLCNKICGVAHYNMNMKVIVVDPSEFKDWIKAQKPVFENTVVAAPATQTVSVKPNEKKIVALK